MFAKPIALIPARGGSKGITRKNLSKVGGISLLERAISAAISSEAFSDVVVTSDDNEILEVAKAAGAICLVRPDNASADNAQATAVVEHFLSSDLGRGLDDSAIVVYLQPTSPFRSGKHIAKALEQMRQEGADKLVSVTPVKDHPFMALTIDDLGFLEPSSFWDSASTNRQDFPKLTRPNGAIYAFSVSEFRALGRIPVEGAIPFWMGEIEGWDIDTFEDLSIARAVANDAGI